MEKVVYIEAKFKPIYRKIIVEVPTGETKKGMFGQEKDITLQEEQLVKTNEFSDTQIDGGRLAKDLEAAISDLNIDGYSITSVVPIMSGAYNYERRSQGITSTKRVFSDTEKVSGGASYGLGYGYSYTDGLIVIARKSDE